jgi:uncharacterized alpha-E superfamily protein
MLARTAENLFWLARYLERTDYVTRLLQVANRVGETQVGDGFDSGTEWHSTIVAAGCEEGFYNKYESANEKNVTRFLISDIDNSSSILSCLETARRNARSVRTALTSDMWDAVNGTWLGLRDFDLENLPLSQVPTFLDWAKERAGLFHGAYSNSMLRTDSFYFTRLGSVLERADNTARILDVKYHILLPRPDHVGGVIDYYQWAALLRVVSALRAYHAIYPGRIRADRVAELLMLKPELPRSLIYCFEQVNRTLELIQDGPRQSEAHRMAGALHAQMKYARMDDIFALGLHEYLTDLIDRTTVLGGEIGRAFSFT